MTGRGRLLLGIGWLCGVVALFEGTARWLTAREEFLLRVGSPASETAWRLRWLAGHADGGLRQGFDDPHPTRGWALRPGLRGFPLPGGHVLNSTARRARGRREHEPGPVDRVRILAIGDSFTFGEGVSDGQAWPAAVEAALPDVEVVNLGVHGYGHDQMLVTLREEGGWYRPDLVLLGYVSDDAVRNLVGFRDFAKPRFELGPGGLDLRGSPVPTPAQVLARGPWGSRFFDIVAMLRERRVDPARAEALTGAILAEIFRTARSLGATPVVADLPVWDELAIRDPGLTPREARLQAVCAAADVPWLPLRPRFLAESASGRRPETRGHWGPGEHWIAGREIAEALRTRGLLRRAPR